VSGRGKGVRTLFWVCPLFPVFPDTFSLDNFGQSPSGISPGWRVSYWGLMRRLVKANQTPFSISTFAGVPMSRLSLPTVDGLSRWNRFACHLAWLGLLLVCLSPVGSLAQDKFEKLKVGETVEVLSLNEWWPGVVIAVDKNDNARVEFEFPTGKQTDDFYRNTIRRPYEEGALLPSRTYTDKSGQFKIVAALMAITDTEVRLRKADGTDKDVPLTSLSKSDQKYLAGLVKKGLQKSDEMPPTYLKGGKTWNLKSGESVQGVFVELKGPDLVIRLLDETTRTLPFNQLTAESAQTATESLTKVMQMEAGKKSSMNSPRESGNSLAELDAANRERERLRKGLSPNTMVKLLPKDQWGFTPDAITPSSRVSHVEIPGTGAVPEIMATRSGSHALVSDDQGSKTYLVDFRDGKYVPSALPADSKSIAISPSGKLTARGQESVGAMVGGGLVVDAVTILDTVSGTPVWKEYRPTSRSLGVIYHMAFIDDEHVLMVSGAGEVGVWNLQSKEIIWWMKARPQSRPAISTGNKLMFVQTMTHLLVLESLTGKIVSQIPSSPTTIELLAVDDACERLAGIGVGQVRVWDLKTGQVLQQFAISPTVKSPFSAAWLSPTLLAVCATYGGAYDLIDLQLQGTNCFLYSEARRSLAGNSTLFFSPRGDKSQIVNPQYPSPEMTQAAERFESSLLCDLKPGSRVMLQVNATKSYDKAAETEQLTKLLAGAGLTVVAEGGEATFVANLRDEYKGPDLPPEQMPKEAFLPKRSLLLMSGERGAWRAYRDGFIEMPNGWEGYIIPPLMRIPSAPPPLYYLSGIGKWEQGYSNEDFVQNFSRELSTNKSGGRGGRPAIPPPPGMVPGSPFRPGIGPGK